VAPFFDREYFADVCNRDDDREIERLSGLVARHREREYWVEADIDAATSFSSFIP
jgi:hypothetical protein